MTERELWVCESCGLVYAIPSDSMAHTNCQAIEAAYLQASVDVEVIRCEGKLVVLSALPTRSAEAPGGEHG